MRAWLLELKDTPAEPRLTLCTHYWLGQVANEAPADIKSNLTRAWANFDQEKIDSCNKPTEYKACLFSLCWFHSIVLGEEEHNIQPKSTIAL